MTTVLSKVDVNDESVWRHGHGNLSNADWVHRFVRSLFPRVEGLRTLHYLDAVSGALYVQSTVAPETDISIATLALDPVIDNVPADAAIQVELLLNATRRSRPDKAGPTRYEKVGDPDAWLSERLSGSGLAPMRVDRGSTVSLRSSRANFRCEEFHVVGRVVDPLAFGHLWRTGLGRAKSYGAGMLRVTPVVIR